MAKRKKKKGNEFSRKKSRWTNHYRMVVLNDDTFEERFSLKLNRLNVFFITAISALLLIVLTTLLIAFTPLREYIPGYSNAKTKSTAVQLTKETDSLRQVLATKDEQYNRIKKILLGDLTFEEYESTTAEDSTTIIQAVPDLSPSEQENELRNEVAKVDRYNILNDASVRTEFVLFTPVSGSLTGSFNPEEDHYAVDIAASVGTPIKAAADGTVIFSGWTVETGYTVIIEHAFGLITVYKHAGELLKQQNDRVESGEVIASIGNTGELTTGPHLHFEIWSDGYPLDPSNFISFK